ncbi:MAG: heavy-metal-associated domain-containing protein [Clostridiales bacterium]|jgi:copper chaperone CopZ|nr:heavy-metal-associated domain-containing protein [Clostridiales bacterium]
MVKILKIENLDCANCAAKMERGIAALAGVKSCSISFLTGKVIIDAEENGMDDTLAAAVKIVKKIESGAKLKL